MARAIYAPLEAYLRERSLLQQGMRLTFSKALALALLASALPGCDRNATNSQEAASRGPTSGQTPASGATGQASEGSTDDRKAPARPSSGY
jgi:hypothetical protein